MMSNDPIIIFTKSIRIEMKAKSKDKKKDKKADKKADKKLDQVKKSNSERDPLQSAFSFD